jgi:hypothetical protein
MRAGIVPLEGLRFIVRDANVAENSWADVYVDLKSDGHVDGAAFIASASASGLAMCGEVAVRGSRFERHAGLAVQVWGRVVLDKCEFAGEVLGEAVEEGGHLRVTGCSFEKNHKHIQDAPKSSVDASDSKFIEATRECGVDIGEGRAVFGVHV